MAEGEQVEPIPPTAAHDRPVGLRLRRPILQDAPHLWRLVRESGTLDLNSAYCYALLTTHFARNCVIAQASDGARLGLATGYRLPERPDTVFLWQVGVAPQARGQGLGTRLVAAFLRLEGNRDARYLETTVSPSNVASAALFHSVSRALGAPCTVRRWLEPAHFPAHSHEAELLYRIGPLGRARRAWPTTGTFHADHQHEGATS